MSFLSLLKEFFFGKPTPPACHTDAPYKTEVPTVTVSSGNTTTVAGTPSPLIIFAGTVPIAPLEPYDTMTAGSTSPTVVTTGPAVSVLSTISTMNFAKPVPAPKATTKPKSSGKPKTPIAKLVAAVPVAPAKKPRASRAKPKAPAPDAKPTATSLEGKSKNELLNMAKAANVKVNAKMSNAAIIAKLVK